MRRTMKSQRLADLGDLHMFKDCEAKLSPRKILEVFNLLQRLIEFDLTVLSPLVKGDISLTFLTKI